MRDLFPPPTPEAAITNLLLLSSAQLCLTLCTVACQAPLSHGISQERILEWVAISFSRGIFPAQGLNSGLLHCRQILYRLSHQGSLLHIINM